MTGSPLQQVRHLLLPRLCADGAGIPLVPDQLGITLVLAGPHGPRALEDDELLSWDRPYVELVHHAMWNLRRGNGATLVPLDTLPGLWSVSCGDGIAASHLLHLEDLLRPWPLEGVVAACPRQDQLLLVPLDGLHALPAIQALLRVVSDTDPDSEDWLSDQLFWSAEGRGWDHLPVEHGVERVDLDPSPAFVAALERMMAVDMVAQAAEA